MKATITTEHHECHSKTFHVIEILKNRIVCLLIGSRKVDFGISEVLLKADASLGCEAIWKFSSYDDCILTNNGIRNIAKRAACAWGMPITECEKAIHQYVFN